MTFEELKSLLLANNIELKEVANALNYNIQSISNNWKNNKPIPQKAELLFTSYINLEIEKRKNLDLQQQLEQYKKGSNLSDYLSTKALNIAQEKCTKNNLTIEEYLSSLVMAKI